MSYFIAGDGPFLFSEQIRDISWLPQIWHPELGLGANALPYLWLDYPFRVLVKIFSVIGFSWFLTEKVIWAMAISMALLSSYEFAARLFGRNKYSVLSAVLYTTNTYALLLFGGGQLGVALGYAFAPFVLLRLMEEIDRFVGTHASVFQFRTVLLNSVLLCFLISLDLRLSVLVSAASGLYFIMQMPAIRKTPAILRLTARVFLVRVCSILLLHAFWIFPVLFVRSGIGLPKEYTAVGMLDFLSVADFSHAFALIHPNWPDNLFGKVYFLQPEFLLLPMGAFASLFFWRKSRNAQSRWLAFLTLLSLGGAFFSKGIQPPFGFIYRWMFVHVPGFIVFRDPTKFYLYTAIGYSMLIPYTLQSLAGRFPRKRLLEWVVFGVGIAVWMCTIRQLPMGLLSGNFKPRDIPGEYVQLKNMLVADTEKSRVLWLPSPEKFQFNSATHPVLSGTDLLNYASPSAMAVSVETSEFQRMIRRAGVKYIVIPMDIEQRMFISDYRYDPRIRERLILAAVSAGYLRLPQFSRLSVFVNPKYVFADDITQTVRPQEYWARIGFFVSVIAGIASLTYLVALRPKR